MANKPAESAQENLVDAPAVQPVEAAGNLNETQAFVDQLAEAYGRASPRITGRPLLAGLDAYRRWLVEAHRYFSEASRKEVGLTYASEWVLDNDYIIQQALREIQDDLPGGYYRQLPKLDDGPLRGFPRIYAIARALLERQQLLVNMGGMQAILTALQERVPLTMGELWALPIFLRYGLIEALAHALLGVIRPVHPPELPTRGPRLDGMEKPVRPQEDPAVKEQETSDAEVANAVLSLRAITEQDWQDFFENTSRVESILRSDPAGVYPQMDFKTRDLYRKAIEELSYSAGGDQITLAGTALELARDAAESDGHDSEIRGAIAFPAVPYITPETVGARQRFHVGYYLLGEGRAEMEARTGFRTHGAAAVRRWVYQHATAVYLGGILLPALLLIALVCATVLPGAGLLAWFAVPLLLIVPALTITTSIASWLVTLLLPPRILPKISFREGVPEGYQTLVTIPAMLTSPEEVDSLAQQLEQHYLRNSEPGLFFALLSDFADADSETLPGDEELLQRADAAIKKLNEKYPPEETPADAPERESGDERAGAERFYFLHRRRQWNPSEGKWIGWERKRGKLHELNQLLRGARDLSFSHTSGDLTVLRGIRFVITLDADTVLPRGAARRLAGALAHPLNQAVFHPRTGQVLSGYTILQPRMEISPTSANRSWFTRIFSGDTGLDLYTLAVSDAYQDLFGEGSYVGKGIYDVDAFERSVGGRIPENRVLSHDLLEGLMGRAGLVTDITMIEDYPPHYFIQMLRQQRWIRGDWQLLPWLLNPGRFGLHINKIDRWKMLDNLRRSLLAPTLVLIFILGLLYLPGPSLLWTGVLLVTLAVPLVTGLTQGALGAIGGQQILSAFRPASWDMVRWLLALALLPYEAYMDLDAILITLYRLFISRRNLLQWTTAAHTARLFREKVGGHGGPVESERRRFAVTLLLVLALAFWILAVKPDNVQLLILAGAAPVLLLWILSPFIVFWIGRPVPRPTVQVGPREREALRLAARRTWSFFEHFVGPEDHWLPPDHFQESPLGIVAHRTSPTNIGLLLTSTMAAYDMGYLDQLALVTRFSATMDTLDTMERYRGHFLNWYDTLTLQPLRPRYVSTVDSGNLVACLLVIEQACRDIPGQPIFRWDLWQGYLDTLALLSDTLGRIHPTSASAASEARTIPIGSPDPATIDKTLSEIQAAIASMREQVLEARETPERWYALYQHVTGTFWSGLSSQLLALFTGGRPGKRAAFDLETLRTLQRTSAQVERHHQAVQRTLKDLTPWIPLLESTPERLRQPEYQAEWQSLRECLHYNPALNQLQEQVESARTHIATLREKLSNDAAQPSEHDSAQWLDSLEQALRHASAAAKVLLDSCDTIASRAEAFVDQMDFRFLYHPQRRIFHIGYNIDSGQLDNNFYDLLASEARIASLITIARGQVPQSHWMQLSRPVTRVDGLRVLLSWSATMFEYLMPPLFLTTFPNTLLDESTRGAVKNQIEYGKSRKVPWGISESGFYRFDANQNYQYRAFGVPALGFKRGLGDDLVIAPYASLMAAGYQPQAVVENMESLEKLGALGSYGYYEAVDFTTERLLYGETSAVVREYMSHHQGMVMMALANVLYDNVMIRRMHSDPRIQSVDLLLEERVPLEIPPVIPGASDSRGVARVTGAPVQIQPWTVPVQTPIPAMHLLSNGSYSLLISNAGGGYSRWNDTDLTRWQPDGTLDPWGSWLYIQEPVDTPEAGGLWSAGYQPVPGDPRECRVTFHAHMAVFRRAQAGIISTMEVTISPDDPLEIRRLHLNNTTSSTRRLRLSSYGEVILTQQAADTRHPAFNRLFIQEEYLPELDLQVFQRRPRSAEEAPLFMGHMLVLEDGQQSSHAHEADRACFFGRGGSPRSPAALGPEAFLSGSSGATLDPIFALGQEIELPPHASVQLAYLTIAGESRDAILALASRYRTWVQIERAFHQADMTAQSWMGVHGVDSLLLERSLQTLSALIYPFQAARAAPERITANHLGQPGLWRFGISGDFPILLLNINGPRQLDLVREALQVHRYLRTRRFLVDVVILNGQQTDYGAELMGMLHRLVSRVNSEQWLNQRGGIFILYADQMEEQERNLLEAAARVYLSGERGSLADQLPGYSIQVPHLPEFVPTRTGPLAEAEVVDDEKKAVPTRRDAPSLAGVDHLTSSSSLQFFNGYGGFTPDGREYVIELAPGKPTPAPWVNVIGYPQFGFLVSEAGSQCTWAVNSGENRISPWFNDPVRDPSGEVLYLRDEETGEVWTPTPLPAGAGTAYTVRHGAGYSIFEHESHGLRQALTLFASPEDPLKVIHLHVTNTWDHPRRITATQYVEWVLGTTHASSMPFLIPEYDPVRECLLAINPYNTEFQERTAFLMASRPVHGWTADRTEFLGRDGSPASPIALRRIGLERRISPGEDPCAVLQLHLDLRPGESQEIFFLLGQANNKEQALALVDKYCDGANVGAAWERTQAFWDRLLNAVQVHTPAPAVDMILNRWLLYQALSCRIWGRTAFYQSSGAFGFRDQLQDVLALLPIDPAIARDQILNAARHQFDAGDVLHWWHPPSGRGVRTRFSDDLLWLPYIVALYVETTGDAGILDEKVPFRQGDPLKEGENERYGEYALTGETFSLFEHCRRAVEKGATHGPHGLPLIGTGDWNDGLNRVGEKGQGESVWLAWFLVDVLDRFAALCEAHGDAGASNGGSSLAEMVERYRQLARAYAQSAERTAWDGEWYRRAYYDDGTPLGSIEDPECNIDSIAQSWAILSGAADPNRKLLDPQHTRKAMQSVLDRLVRPDDRLILLFTPPFDQTPRDPGYIKGYLPGIRENGGQYTHAATWAAWAFARLGDGAQASALFDLLNPIYQADDQAKASAYRVEPYVICADIYSVEPYLRRGGWTWYTGSAAWMYRLGLEAILGFNRLGDRVRICPAIPPGWEGFSITYRNGTSLYQIQVSNPQRRASGVSKLLLDGKDQPDGTFPLVDDGKEHKVDVEM